MRAILGQPHRLPEAVLSIARANGVDLYYEVRGSGPRIHFLNGSGSTLEDSRLIVGALASRFEVLAFDYRGLGKSGPLRAGYTMADCAADALAVLDAAGWESAPVVGISFGGMVALELAVRHPERMDRLVLLCTSSGGRGGSSYPLHELEDLPTQVRTARRRELLDTRFDDAWLASHPSDRNLVAVMERRSAESADLPAPARDAFRAQLGARRSHDTWERLAAIRCPTFIGSGRFDGIAPPGNSRALASRISGSELHEYEGGHAFLAQDPNSLGDVFEFLGRPSSPPGPVDWS